MICIQFINQLLINRSTSAQKERTFLEQFFVLAVFLDAIECNNCTVGSSLSTSLTKFSVSLYQATSKSIGKYDNIVLSPSSISLVLAMTLIGARGNTANQIKKAFHMTFQDDETIACNIGALNRPAKGNGNILSSVNRVLVSDEFRLTESFRSTLQNQFTATAENINFSLPLTIETINKQIEKLTNDKITNLIPKGSFGAQTKLILLNAIYFKGNWLKAFDSTKSQVSPFYVSPNHKPIPTKMMVSRNYFRTAFINEANLQALELPYSGSQFSMVILLPNRLNGLALLESSLSSKLLDLIDRRWNKIQVDVVIPIFKFESSPDLKRALRSVGIVDLFNDDADLSGISGSKDLYVTDAFHRTIIEVNEKGTEAAAATARSFRRTPFIPKFVADHPFIFLIRDTRTNTIRFVGRFCKPEKIWLDG
uniref:Serpin domain-containing protein n=1 Tax=Daphnia galeata TaxID=27404 RepID=A0A8J2RZ45_9CRUS|nr:unnamed protein product [Daphnia galeata]